MSLKDSELIELLQSRHSSEQNKAFVYLYDSLYDPFHDYVMKRGGQQFEVEDLLQEGLVIFYKLAVQGKLLEVKDLKSYLFSICRNLWLKSKTKNKVLEEIDDSTKMIGEEPTVMNHLLSEERAEVLQLLLQRLGEDCKKILLLFYYQELSIKKILEQVHYASESALKNKKSKCMKALRTFVQNNPHLKKYLVTIE